MDIWCIEDDENINNLITYALQSQGFEAQGFLNFTDFEEKLKAQLPHLVMLDIMLPDTDGLTILKRLKADPKFKAIPIIMLTAKNAEMDIVKALDLGAEDYITKPFGVLEMVSRVKAVLRRCEKQISEIQIFEYDSIKLYPDEHRVTVENRTVDLTPKEFSVLKLLMASPYKVFTRENIMDTVWGDSYVGESRTVDMHIKTLRQKLGTGADKIMTIR
ncbi:MAG: response regulator transcription factor, partial [Oscillospiraceae bacterium]